MKRGLLASYTFILIISSICFISASHIVTTSTGETSYDVNESAVFTYNLTINNTDLTEDANITQINITLPSEFDFETGTEGTSSGATFSTSGNTLTWSRDGAVMNLTFQNFWFDANSTEPDSYTLTITTLNASGASSSMIDVEILDISPCTENWACTNWTGCAGGRQIQNCTDLNFCGTITNKPDGNRTCTIDCVPNWECTNWSGCIGGNQIQVCADLNLCGNDTNKPLENRSCNPPCVPDWQCTGLEPETCPKNETQTQKCTDKNGCGITTGKPKEEQSCTYETSPTWIYVVIIGLSVIVVIIVIMIIFKFIKKPKDEMQGIGPPPRYQQFPPRPPPRTFPQMPPQRPAIMQRPNYPPPPSKPL